MHEMSIAQSIIEIVLEENSSHQNIKEVYFKASSIHQIIPESLIFYYDIIKIGYPLLKNSKLIVESESLVGKCKKCNSIYEIENLFFICKNCNLGLEIIQGNEMYIDKIILLE